MHQKSQDKDPYKRLNKLMGRCLSVLWKIAISSLHSVEIVGMNDTLHPIRRWLSRLADPPHDFRHKAIERSVCECVRVGGECKHE